MHDPNPLLTWDLVQLQGGGQHPSRLGLVGVVAHARQQVGAVQPRNKLRLEGADQQVYRQLANVCKGNGRLQAAGQGMQGVNMVCPGRSGSLKEGCMESKGEGWCNVDRHQIRE